MSKFSKTGLGLFIVIFSGFYLPGFSQATSMGKVNIASPNAASLGKYGDIPVSYHTGVPNISIPLYSIKSGSLQMPISLSYHASGLKVEEQDSWVGAGWTLIAGGAITRTVKSKPDEKQTNSLSQTYGYFSDYGLGSIYPQNGPTSQLPEFAYDGEPDLFSFNFNGYSGKFYFNDDRTPMIVPEQDIKIECSYTPGIWTGSPGVWAGLGRCIESFIITTPDGTKYYFGLNGASAPYCDPIEVSSTLTAEGGISFSQVISSWFLNRIVSADGNASINLYYERDKFAVYTFGNGPTFSNGYTPVEHKYDLVKTLLAGVRLSKITGSNEHADFTPGAAREDVSSWKDPTTDLSLADNPNTTSPVLSDLSILDNDGNCFKKFNFYYDYFSDNTTPVHANFSGITSDKKRLRLDSLNEQTCDASVILPSYKFDYFTEQVRRKLSFSRDHWGYNNGVTTNSQLYPLLTMSGTSINTGLGIACRSSVWPEMRAGTLNKITYPTGGSTTFEFEPNTFTVNTGSGETADSIVGGLRIKTVSNYDPITNQTISKNYSYNSPSTGKSSGVLFGRPIYMQIFRNDFSKKNNFMGNPNGNGCYDNFNASDVIFRQYVFSDNPIRPMESTQGYHIGYGEVKVSQPGNGYSIYKFHVDPPYPAQIIRDGVAATSIINPCTCSIDAIPNYPAAPLATDYLRGEPTQEGDYNENGNLVREKYYGTFYEENPVTIPGRLSFSFLPGPESLAPITLETFYELKTARKTQTIVEDRNYQPNGEYIASQTQTLYSSPYHHQPTNVITTDSKGKVNEKKFKYAFDYRLSTFDNTSNCYTGVASFIDYTNSVYVTGNYQAIFNACTGYTDGSCMEPAMHKYDTTIWNARKRYVDSRKLNYTNISPLNIFQLKHNTAKERANPELKQILWMQDIYMNSPIETSEWKDGKLLKANYVKYNNNRNDDVGIYPEKSQQIDLSTPSVSFNPSTVSSDSISITNDSRYKNTTLFDFNRGNPISVVSRDGIASSYGWGYDEKLPVVKIVNAVNKYKETLVPASITSAISFDVGGSAPNENHTVSFTQSQLNNITITLPPLGANLVANATLSAHYELTGPNGINVSGDLCSSAPNVNSCGASSSVTFVNKPAGEYTLTISASISTGIRFLYSPTYSYQGLVISSSGLKEFYYESFEENSDVNVNNGNAKSGKRFWNGNSSFVVNFPKPNARNYSIQWWSFDNGKWIQHQQAYNSNSLSLSGIIDEIRIFPDDAQMSTYTYNPLLGMTSQTDPNGKTTYYEYDRLGRFKYIRDQDGNIMKKYEYQYQQ